MPNFSEEQLLLEALRAGQEAALDQLFRTYYAQLCQAVYRVLPDRQIAEDIAQEVFYELWRKRSAIQIKQAIGPYLRRAAVNKTLNYIRAQKMPIDDESYLPLNLSNKNDSAQEQLQANELELLINEAIDLLPERCRLIFTLSRYEEMSNKEIAAHLDLSIKTIENQMTKALKLLRTALSSHLPSWMIFLLVAFSIM